MNIYSRIRSIEDAHEFKRVADSILGLEHGENYQSIKEWRDFGVDGYQKKDGVVYAFYCPCYPERRELKQYKTKIADDIIKLAKSIKENKLNISINEWTFVTPDDLAMEVIEFIRTECEKNKWKSGTLTAQVLAPLFMKHKSIHIDFPMITSGLQLDKVPSISVGLAKNRGYSMLEVFNDGTEDIKDIKIALHGGVAGDRDLSNNFMYEYDDPVMGSAHSLFNLKKGERQYGKDVPTAGNFGFKISGVGVESNKTFIKEGFIELVQ